MLGHFARFGCEEEVYVDDKFFPEELQLLCGTYEIGIIKQKGKRQFRLQLNS